MAKLVVDHEEVYEVEVAASLLKISIATLWRRIKSKDIKTLKTLGRTFIPASEVDRINGDDKDKK